MKKIYLLREPDVMSVTDCHSLMYPNSHKVHSEPTFTYVKVKIKYLNHSRFLNDKITILSKIKIIYFNL